MNTSTSAPATRRLRAACNAGQRRAPSLLRLSRPTSMARPRDAVLQRWAELADALDAAEPMVFIDPAASPDLVVPLLPSSALHQPQ